MSERSDFLALLARNRRRVDAERREFAQRVDATLRSQARDSAVFGVNDLARVRIALRPVFDEFYGIYPGDTRARFYHLILEEARQARALAFRRPVALVREAIRPARGLLAAIEKEAG